MQAYSVSDWYWVVDGSATQVWSSVSRSYASLADEAYQAWLAQGGFPTPISSADLPDVVNAPILAEITALEAKQARPLRDIALGHTSATGSPSLTPTERIEDLDTQIAALREQLL